MARRRHHPARSPAGARGAGHGPVGGTWRPVLDEQLLRPLRAAWPAIDVDFDDERQAGRTYYTDVCFAVHAVEPDGSRSNLSDGGFTDWTARLLADSKERLLISGLGSERLVGLATTVA